MTTHPHPDHRKELQRLRRIGGQVEGICRMIEEQRYCPDILTQLRATRAALLSVEANILETHLAHCTQDAMQSADTATREAKIAELKTLFRRFQS